jgi:serine/threonine protein kinase
VHRDLKPSNLFPARLASGRTTLKVLDFGIARHTAAGSTTGVDLTHSFAVLGSPAYMSPEQVRAARQVDARTDVWALGVVLYELLSGGYPFEGETATAMPLARTARAARLPLRAPQAPSRRARRRPRAPRRHDPRPASLPSCAACEVRAPARLRRHPAAPPHLRAILAT